MNNIAQGSFHFQSSGVTIVSSGRNMSPLENDFLGQENIAFRNNK